MVTIAMLFRTWVSLMKWVRFSNTNREFHGLTKDPTLGSIRTWIVGAILFSLALVVLAVPALQPGNSSSDIAALLPPGAMIYLESNALMDQLKEWNDSRVKQGWLESANFASFQKSRLYLRLSDKLAQFENAAEVALDFSIFRTLSGKKSGLGLYDIRDLEFVFVTEVPNDQFNQGPFFRRQARYEQRSAEGGSYFARSRRGGTITYAFRGDLFFLATSESLLRATLHNAADPSVKGGLNAEPIFQEAQTVLSRGGDLWMFLNMSLVKNSRYFRNEWLYGNLKEIEQYRAGVVQLERTRGQYKEERQFLLKEDTPSSVGTIDPKLVGKLPGKVELLKAQVSGPEETAFVIHNVLLNSLRTRDQTISFTRSGLSYDTSQLLKSSNRYALQIDEPIVEEENPQLAQNKEKERLIAELAKELNLLGVKSLVRCDSPSSGSQGYRAVRTVFILNSQTKEFTSLKQVLQNQYNYLYHSGAPAAWKSINGNEQVLGDLRTLALKTEGSLLYLGNSENLIRLISDGSVKPNFRESIQDLEFYSRLDMNQFRGNYQSLFHWLDYQTGSAIPGAAQPYFSANLGSLIETFSPLQNVTISRRRNEKGLHEEITYRIQ